MVQLSNKFLRRRQNFLSLLGWSLDDKTEFLTRDEIVKYFSLERVSKAAAVFNKEKLDWMNGVYLRGLSPDEFTMRVIPFMERDIPLEVKRPLETSYIRQIVSLIQERAKTLAEVPQLSEFFFVDKPEYDTTLLLTKLDHDQAVTSLQKSISTLEVLVSWDTASLEKSLRSLAEDIDLKPGTFFGLLRVAITGRTAAPPLFQTMEVLGKRPCLNRLAIALDKLSASEVKPK